MEYQIRKHQQYDYEGARAEFGPLFASFTRTGAFDAGNLPRIAHQDTVHAAILRVIASGIDEVLTIDEPSALPVMPAGWAALQTALDNCRLWTDDQGCPAHGELCHRD